MMMLVSRVLRALRSRRLAVGLLAGFGVWSWLATIVPRGSAGRVSDGSPASVVLGSAAAFLGLREPFVAPIFIAIVGLLWLSTIACAWERTSWAAKRWSRRDRVPDALKRRLRMTPDLRMRLRCDVASANDHVTKGLRRLGLRVRVVDSIVEGRKGTWAIWASPVFHWGLVLLIAVVVAGRLTRADMTFDLPMGETTAVRIADASKRSAGPLYPGGPTDLALVARDLQLHYTTARIDRGPTAEIALSRGTELLVRQSVYPNNPLRYGTLLVHRGKHGLAAFMSHETSAGVEQGRTRIDFTFDFTGKNATGISSQELLFPALREGLGATVTVTVPLDRRSGRPLLRLPAVPRARVLFGSGASSMATATAELLPGDSVILADGSALRLVRLDYYVQAYVADDWSVPWLYAFAIISCAAVSCSILVRTESAWVVLSEDGDGVELSVVTRSRHRDALLLERVKRVIATCPDEAADAIPLCEEER